MNQNILLLLTIICIISIFSGCIKSNIDSYIPPPTPKNIEPVAHIITAGTLITPPSIFLNDSIDGFIYAGDTVIFDGSESYDPDGEIISYYWIFYDGSTADSSEVSWIFDIDNRFCYLGTASQYSIILEVKDTNDSISSKEYIIGVIPKSYLFYLDSGLLIDTIPSQNHDALKGNLGRLREVESIEYQLDTPIYISASMWNITVFLSKSGFSFVTGVRVVLYDSSGDVIDDSQHDFSLFEIRNEKTLQFNGVIGSAVEFQSMSIYVKGFSIKRNILLRYGGPQASFINFDFI
ncbi:MAG: PKD domain-containing protein [Thermoplasmatota archaeon]